jgi:hypothetical protein
VPFDLEEKPYVTKWHGWNPSIKNIRQIKAPKHMS